MQSLLAFPLDDSEIANGAINLNGFAIRAADSWGERSSASLLINRLYARRGYRSSGLEEDDPSNRLTLVARLGDKVVGTLTIGFDSGDGLLVDDLFADEVNSLRDDGRQVCEFTKLAMDDLVRSQRVLAALFHVAFIHAHCVRGCDSLLIEVNPRHVRYYKLRLGFRQLAHARLNRRVNAPAVLLGLDLWRAHEQVKSLGGMQRVGAADRSLYRFGFSAQEEHGIVRRIRNSERAEGSSSCQL